MSPTREQIETMLSRANLAPSPDNCQPWDFEWNGETLSIFHLSARSNHPLNPANLTAMVTFGCLLESLEIAASEFHLKTETAVGPFLPDPRARWASVRFSGSTNGSDSLLKMLALRTTDRRLFNGGGAELAALSLPSSNAKAQTHRLTSIAPDLHAYIINSEQFLPDHPGVLPAIMKWVRFTLRHARASGDGISWRNMMVKVWEIPAMLIVRSFPPATALFRAPARRSHRARTKAQLASSAGLICVSVQLTDRRVIESDLVEAGRLMFRTWLVLTQAGFGVQPLSLSTLPLLYRNAGNLDEFFTSRNELLEHGEFVLRQAFSIPEDRLPLWMIRTGLSSPLPPEMQTFRRPVNDSFTV